jgi:hypothetical protein
MTVQFSHAAAEALSHGSDADIEPRRTPVALYLAGAVVVMNVCATMLSLLV